MYLKTLAFEVVSTWPAILQGHNIAVTCLQVILLKVTFIIIHMSLLSVYLLVISVVVRLNYFPGTTSRLTSLSVLHHQRNYFLVTSKVSIFAQMNFLNRQFLLFRRNVSTKKVDGSEIASELVLKLRLRRLHKNNCFSA